MEFLKKLLVEYKSRLFVIYWLRWMLSAVVMLPFMLLFEWMHTPLWLNLFLGQTIGAIIFFKIDKFIFRKQD
ncbi:hypothetical protein [Helicobacter bizzozeronii]|uniref:hypothetical protein n=1 Tax=Helicobacter bizzozeronii TaxID=56877 RepID=UPI000CEDBFCF|nr:hypothetical protein [Helicobacter bizzozeronii]